MSVANGSQLVTDHAGRLTEVYVVPPFSVLDTRQGYWQERRRWWLTLGIRSELGRGAKDVGEGRTKGVLSSGIERAGFGVGYDTSRGENAWGGSGTSIFDPVLCEMAYRWWCPPGGSILDPFAGGSVRGIVAAMLGHAYTGVDLSAAQVEANRDQAAAIVPSNLPMPRWIVGDSRDVLPNLADNSFDMAFTCPPYYDLEVYSNHPDDLSALPTYGEFERRHAEIISAAARALRPGRFAVWVVSEVRGKDGTYVGLVPDTVLGMRRAGLDFYNEAVLVNSAGSLPLRVQRHFNAGRKLGRMHQNVLVSVKGKPEKGWDHKRQGPPNPQLDLFAELAS